MNQIRTKVIFFQVNNARDKLKKIVQTAEEHLEKQEPLLILVPDSAAAHFVDEWLWKWEETSFLPHLVSEEKQEEIILISTLQEPHKRSFLFNLSPSFPLIDENIRIFYEFEDTSSLERQEIYKKKFHTYREYGFLIESR